MKLKYEIFSDEDGDFLLHIWKGSKEKHEPLAIEVTDPQSKAGERISLELRDLIEAIRQTLSKDKFVARVRRFDFPAIKIEKTSTDEIKIHGDGGHYYCTQSDLEELLKYITSPNIVH